MNTDLAYEASSTLKSNNKEFKKYDISFEDIWIDAGW